MEIIPFLKALSVGTGFPDFIAFRLIQDGYHAYELIGIEVKRKGYLDKEERKKAKWYIENKVFTRFYIAKAVQNGRKIEVNLVDFKEKYLK